ncbi:MAG: GMC family oxidoreductase N-terminal domain-containing protein [Planctomycetes bacterium]|nr:GMC family oxidoreductase N-terminal domain-containing protein [Planctomycetota bacterium]
MGKLASSIESIRADYDVVVVGSGYGGGIAASRLARAGRRVCVLERGREVLPSEFPDTTVEALGQMQIAHPGGHLGQPTGLYDFRLGPDINVLVGCGLGGTSLINASVVREADPRVFQDSRWPAAVRADGLLQEGYRRARAMLRPVKHPPAPRLPKLQALELAARGAGLSAQRADIAVTFQDGVNHVGVDQRACTGCGDCVSGCNVGAKNTVAMNYLPDARNHGAELFTEVRVTRVERANEAWTVWFELQGAGRELFQAPRLFVRAPVVVLAAGSLGSTEILLRSAREGLPVSQALGTRFTGNGDLLAFGYNCDHEVNGIGHGHAPAGRPPVGPCITGVVDTHPSSVDVHRGLTIEEGALPGALASVLPAALAAVAASGTDTDDGLADALREGLRQAESLVHGAYRGAVRNTVTYLVMSHDDGQGRLVLEGDRLRVRWPGVGGQRNFDHARATLERLTASLGGTFVQAPPLPLSSHGLTTVHPLGGCAMATSAERGVVDDRGRVFKGASGADVHDGLYVMDGAVIPMPIGVNPLLTISALSERAVELLARDRGWTPTLGARPPASPAPGAVGIAFTETMHGFMSPPAGGGGDHEAAADFGRRDDLTVEFVVTIVARDLAAMLADELRAAPLVGTVTAPWLVPGPLTATGGMFQLFSPGPTSRVREMRYALPLVASDGRRFHLEGFKTIRDDDGPDAWSDTTTLRVTLRKDSDQGEVLALGVLRLTPYDLARQLSTMQVHGAVGAKARLEAMLRFGRFFAGSLLETYGGIAISKALLGEPPRVRKRRDLRAPHPELRAVTTADDVALRLTRYRGGERGPVLLSHGLGVSSRIFTIDTIETNLLEYLVAAGFDTWLLDHRASIALPAPREPFTADEVAQHDYRAALQVVSKVTGRNVHVVGHCFGAMTLAMALLSGLEGVTSAFFSQIAAHAVVPPLMQVKTGLHLPDALDLLGFDALSAQGLGGPQGALLDAFAKLSPVERDERCASLVCRRISFLYGPLYEHERLDPETHAALDEMFGVAPITAFRHLARIARVKHVVGAGGQERYLPNLGRLNMPITLIHGANNGCFLPGSTAATQQILTAAGRQVVRHVVPGYGHIDCIFGKDAVRDVFPLVLDHLDRSHA